LMVLTPRPSVVKEFLSVIYVFLISDRAFVRGRPFQTSQMLVGLDKSKPKSRSYVG
jgi:hypothetical protein